jgi:hypothetical protein
MASSASWQDASQKLASCRSSNYRHVLRADLGMRFCRTTPACCSLLKQRHASLASRIRHQRCNIHMHEVTKPALQAVILARPHHKQHTHTVHTAIAHSTCCTLQNAHPRTMHTMTTPHTAPPPLSFQHTRTVTPAPGLHSLAWGSQQAAQSLPHLATCSQMTQWEQSDAVNKA